MTELEMLQRAKMYMDKLANGIDPILDLEAPPEDIIHNVRLARCFFYVSDVLRRCIENGGVDPAPRQKREPKAPFSLTLEQRNQILFSQESISVSVLTERINALIDAEHMTALKTTQITDWLVDAGFLAVIPTQEGRQVRRATEAGDAMGIHNEERNSIHGPYTGVFYEEKAQRFLVDNLDSILSFSEEKIRNEGKPWSPEENAQIRALFAEGLEPGEIAARLCRKTASVKRQLKKIGP